MKTGLSIESVSDAKQSAVSDSAPAPEETTTIGNAEDTVDHECAIPPSEELPIEERVNGEDGQVNMARPGNLQHDQQ